MLLHAVLNVDEEIMSSKVDDDKLSTVKTEIYCTLISTKDGLTLRDFLRDYKETVGKPFPHTAFGFKNPMDFIKSMPDVVSILKPCGSPELLLPVSSDKSAHINKFILEQKKTKKTYGRPRPVQLPTDSRRHLLATPLPLLPIPVEPVGGVRGWENRHNIPPRTNEISNYHSSSYQAHASNSYRWIGMKQTMTTMTSLPVYNNYPPALMELNPANTLFQPQFQHLQSPTSFAPHGNHNIPFVENGRNESPHTTVDDVPITQDDTFSNNEDHGRNSVPDSEDGKKLYPNGAEEICFEENNEDNFIEYDDEDDCSSLVGDKMKMNFRLVLKEYPNGILTSKFPIAYQKKFQVPLNQNDLGFQTVKELVMACSDVFKIHKTKKQKDWLLFDSSSNVISTDDSSKWIPKQVLENMEQLSKMFPKGIESEDILIAYKDTFQVPLDVKKLGFETLTSFLVNCQSVECKMEEEKCIVFPVNWGKKHEIPSEFDDNFTDPFLTLENVNFLWKKHFSDHVCDPTFKFEKFILPSDKNMRVLVSDAISPDVIWLQNASTGKLLNDMMFELNNFYDEEEENYKLQEIMVIPSLACCVKYNPVNRWHRAVTCTPSENNEVKVLYVDYGTTGFVGIDDLRILHKKFSDLPVQAIKAKLHDIVPIDENGWSEAAVEYLFEICLDNFFMAEIVTVKPEIPSIEVVLCDTTGVEDFIVNEVLIANHFALPAKAVSPSFMARTISPAQNQQNYPLMSYPECFLKLLPSWLCVTGDWILAIQLLEQAKNVYMKEASLCKTNERNSGPPPSCCSHHLLSHLFVHKPKMFCEVWAKTVESFGNSVEQQFIRNLSSEMALPLNLKNSKRLYCSNETEVHNASNGRFKSDLTSCSNNERYAGIQDKQISSGEVFDYQCNGKSSDDDDDSENKSVDASHEKRRVLRSVINARIGEKTLHFVRYNSKVYVLMDELLRNFASSVPKNLVRHRLMSSRLNIGPVQITPEDKLIHGELFANGVIGKNELVSMVPLTIAGNILSAVEPVQTAVADVLRNMAKTCNADHSNWYE